jgi:hypothetical protein
MGSRSNKKCVVCGGVKSWKGEMCKTCSNKSRKRPEKIRFWEKVKKTKTCWIWKGTVNNVWGYGQFSVDGVYYRAHRFAYELVKGKIPDGLLVCHSCDNKLCVNPKHLWVGTQSDNIRDAVSKNRTCKGSKNGMSTLSIEQVYEIKRLLKKGMYQDVIADRFDVSQGCVSDINNGRRWGWLE